MVTSHPSRRLAALGRRAVALPLVLALLVAVACFHQLVAFLAPAAGAAHLRAARRAGLAAPSRLARAARGGAEDADDDYEFNPAEVIGELKAGQEFEGVVTAVLDFGAFVDIGTDRQGLVPISKLQDGRTEDPNDVVKVGQGVTVWVVAADGDRLTLSMSKNKITSGLGARTQAPRADLALYEGISSSEWLDGTVAGVAGFGAFVSVKPPGGGEAEAQGLVHITQLKDGFVDNVADEVSVGQEVKVRILRVDLTANKMALSMKPEGAEGGGGGGGSRGDLSAFESIPDTEWLPGTVKALVNFGAFVEVQPPSGGAPAQGLVHISQIKDGFIEDPGEELEVDQEVKVRILNVEGGKMSLSMKEMS